MCPGPDKATEISRRKLSGAAVTGTLGKVAGTNPALNTWVTYHCGRDAGEAGVAEGHVSRIHHVLRQDLVAIL